MVGMSHRRRLEVDDDDDELDELELELDEDDDVGGSHIIIVTGASSKLPASSIKSKLVHTPTVKV